MAVFTTALAIAAAAKGASSFLGSQSTSRDMQEAGRNSLLTARYNINQRKLESRQTQFGILEQGHQAASNIQRSANQAVGTATAAAGGSGAIVESGTPRAVLTNIAQEGLHAQMGAILNTKNAMKANRRQTEAHNKTEWKQANAYAKGMERDAKRTMDNARMNLAADTIKAVATYYTPTVGGTTDKVIKGAGAVKGMTDAQRSHKSVNLSRMQSGRNVYNKSLSGGQASNIRNISSSGRGAYEGKRVNSQWMSHPQVIQRKSNRNWKWHGNKLSSSWRGYNK